MKELTPQVRYKILVKTRKVIRETMEAYEEGFVVCICPYLMHHLDLKKLKTKSLTEIQDAFGLTPYKPQNVGIAKSWWDNQKTRMRILDEIIEKTANEI